MDADLIASVPLFASLGPEDVRALAENFLVRELPEGAILFREGVADQSVFILLDGEVEIIKALGTSGERPLGNRAAGAVFGEMSLFNPEGLHTASVRAHTPLRLLEIPLSDFESLLRRSPGLLLELLRVTARRLEASENATILDLLEKNRQLAQAYQELQAAQEQIIIKEKLEHELDLARKMQHSILPRQIPQLPGYEIGALMAPARVVGGDFYDFIPLDDGRLGIVVGDVCGKGMPAALVMTLSYSLIQAEALRFQEAAEALELVNRHLIRMDISETFVTVLFGILEPASGRFAFSRAGHPQPIFLDASGGEVKVPFDLGRPLGLFEPLLVDNQVITIPPNGLLLIYSDGLSEAPGEDEGEMGTTGIVQLLQSNLGEAPSTCCRRLIDAVNRVSGPLAQADDITLVALRRGAGVEGSDR